MRVKDLMIKVVDQLKHSGVEDSRRIAVWIFCDVLNWGPTHLNAYNDLMLSSRQASRILQMTQRCATHEPIQYVLNYTEFCGLNLNLSPDVFIPRPETEQLVELSLSTVATRNTRNALDIGTGSGCIALSIKHFLPDANVTACDISRDALAIAEGNAEKLQLGLSLLHADVLSKNFIDIVGIGYDLVISNPPYIPDYERSELPIMVQDFEPDIALFCGDDPMKYYQSIAEHLDHGLLSEEGVLLLETHSDYAKSVSTLFQQRPQCLVEIKHDLNQMLRFVVVSI